MSTQFADQSEPSTVVTPEVIEHLLVTAKTAPLLRARLCLHSGPDDPLHEMIIAFRRGSYVPPHRHPGKTESFHVLAGEIDVALFADDGSIERRIRLSAERPHQPRVYRLRHPCWHAVWIRSDTAVVHETTNGPFRVGETEIAPWALTADYPASLTQLFESTRFDSTP